MNLDEVDFLLVFYKYKSSISSYHVREKRLKTRRNNNSSQMSVIRKSINLLTIILVITSTITLITNNQNVQVDAGLIQIYHKYKPKLTQPSATSSQQQQVPSSSSTIQTSELIDNSDHLNTSSSAPLREYEEFRNLHQIQQQKPLERPEITPAIEYASPMKRIMELIVHHPVVVVQDSSEQQKHHDSITTGQQQPQYQQRPAAKADISNGFTQATGITYSPSNFQQLRPHSLNQIASTTSDHQQWALLDGSMTNQMMQPMLSAQPRQLIQTTTPYEQYYISPANVDPDQLQHHQITVMPANIGYSHANSYQHLATNPFLSPIDPQAQSIPQMHQLKQQISAPTYQQHRHNGLEDRAQPVFLSSYVPEVTMRQQQQSVAPINQNQQQSEINNQQVKTTTEQRPDSIQQIQNSQTNQQSSLELANKLNEPTNKTSSSSSLGKESLDNENPSSNDADSDNDLPSSSGSKENNDELDDADSNNELEEPSKIKRSHKDPKQLKQQSATSDDEQDDPASGGSMIYEDKYDSDKEEPRSVHISTKDPKRSESNMIANGLVTVGLNEDCLQCICRASSGCDHLLRCITRGADEKYCGPFQLTEEYWRKAGSPGEASNTILSFEDCANDADCAVETVTNYMSKYHKDCDGDDLITCMDYARLHRLKPNECGQTERLVNEFDAYWPKFQRCAEGYNRSRNGDDEDI